MNTTERKAEDVLAAQPIGWLHEIEWVDGWGGPKYRHGPKKPLPHVEQCPAKHREIVASTVKSDRFTPVYGGQAVTELIEAASRLERKAIEQSRTTSSVFTSDVASLRAALARVQGGQ